MAIEYHRLNVMNFMPFYGHHSIEFTGQRPVTVVYGENMWGKTSLLNSLRWVWYGTALDRFKNPISIFNLVNWDAADEDNYSVQVELFFSVDDDEFHLTRKIQPKFVKSAPQRDADFEELLFLTQNSLSIKTAEIQPLLNSYMPWQVSDFFLFDGEQLDEYEQLLLDPASQSSLIQDSIEDILGLPALINAIKDLGANHKDAAKRQRGLAAKDQAAKSYVDMAERTESAIENTEADVARMIKQRNTITHEIQILDKELRATAGLETELQRLNDISTNIRQSHEELRRLDDDRKNMLSVGWKDLISPVISDTINNLREEQARHLKNFEKAGELRTRQDQFANLLSSKSCPVCNQKYPDSVIQSSEHHLNEIQAEIENLHFDHDRLSYLSDSINKLMRFKPASVNIALNKVEQDIRKVNVNLVGYETKRSDIQRKLEGHDETSIAENRMRYNQLMKRIGTIETDIKEGNNTLQRLKSEAAEYRTKISQSSGPQLDRLNREVSTYDSLLDIFTGAVERLRKQVKVDIERDASYIFLQLTTEPSYIKLQINDRYGLSIIREGGKEVPIRSAGAEQIVALSLISALNNNAVRRAPVFMDTPFGRLDPKHTANVLNYLSSMARQVVLFVHSGEIGGDSDISRISQHIDAEYSIERISVTRSSLHKSSILAGEK